MSIKGEGCNTLSLVDFVLSFKFGNANNHNDEYWVVFDKDDFDKISGRNQFDDAINKAYANQIKVAYSNESFELWYLFHFRDIHSQLTREIYCEKLTEDLIKLTNGKIKSYEKSFNRMYILLKENEFRVVQRAEKMIEEFKEEPLFAGRNPSITVHYLVNSLRGLASQINK